MSFLRRRSILYAAAAGVIALPSLASAGTLAAWDLTSNASSPSGLAAPTVNSPATAGSLIENGSVTGNTATYTYDTKGYVAGVQTDNVEASLTVGAATNVTDLVFSAFASNTGPGTVDVYYSADGGALTHLTNLTIGTASGASASNFDLTFGSLTINSSLNVYFSADASGVSASGGTLGSSGTFRLNNVSDSSSTPLQFEGSAASSPVPSPATIPAAIAGLGLIGGAAAVRRRRQIAL